MGENNGGFEGEIHLPGGSFSRLLLSSDDVEEKALSLDSSVSQTPLFSSTTPKMLCFGDFSSKVTPKSTLTTSINNTNLTSTNSNKRRNGSSRESGLGLGSGSGNSQKNGMKKNKPEVGPIVASSLGHAKKKQGRREKLGERINVLQQLVCPYGKTDTASVLHEAMGYIRFLHDQVKVLSTPYLKRLPCLSSSSSSSPNLSLSENNAPSAKEKDSTEGLRSRGLCLVPLECIYHVANSNGADFWSPNISSSEPLPSLK